jgi:hypothetical protein
MRNPIWLALGLSALVVLSNSSLAGAQKGKTDLKKVRQEMELLESVLNQGLTQSFGGPFGYLEKVRGVYLPGFGVVFSFEVNLTPSNIAGPFSGPPSPEALRAQGKEAARRLEDAKAMAEKTLADFGHTLDALGPTESVAIAIHTVAAQPEGVVRETVVVQCEKQLIDSYEAKSIDRATFLRDLVVVEY